MVTESLWGSEAGPFTVRTKHGSVRVQAFPFKGHQILILARSFNIKREALDKLNVVQLPEGAALVQNKELSRRTAQRVTHQIVTGGIYDLFRSLAHVARTEKEEVGDMHKMRQLTFDCIGSMRAWGVLSGDEQEAAISLFALMGEELDEPKRNLKKRTASDRYQKAARLRTSRGKTAPMPAALTASAGASHLDKRSKEARDIANFFTPRRIEVYERIQEVHRVMDDVWDVFQTLSSNFNAVGLAARRPTQATKRLAQEKISSLARALEHIRVRPYIGLLDGLLKDLRTLRKEIDAFVPSEAMPAIHLASFTGPIRSKIRAMRFIRCVEMRLILPLAFLEQRWKRWNKSRREDVALFFRRNFLEVHQHLERLHDEELSKDLRAEALSVFAEIQRGLLFSSLAPDEARKSVRKSKKLLKTLVYNFS
ncbi:hypothetical protein COX00_03350 [Candidatus Uhrbacteria bacterium CG22_combo_CG10-13_8_21_14_all_47_17]|uniref:Uncharacterized protein n=1 Tax=Candidatus Uhrbacteria bacterium CG22_combo_CG10-13_8_21_14_all_47_17 TaxID=1975041 RepID=A0A2H0BS30_9BACT|nr:MAG: hypothetical protein COX00_03350 [Candidatus Uhrbacteria bacterium CG22_combo_CG10-13_8_21_14_all_47_17]